MADAQVALRHVALDDKYDLTKDRVFITGTQAIVRLLLMQRERDRLAGLNTAGFVSGYRGSPIGGLDQNLWRAKKWLEAQNIVFQPGLNEELAATAVWGTQQAELRGDGKYDGVFGMWYGKGPGVDRSGDVFRHANMAGSSRHGGVLALMGDDHTAESSTVAHQSEFHFVDVMIPILNPAGVQEILDYGLYGYAMSRFCGTWVAFKCVKENIESTASVDGHIDRVKIVIPDDFQMPPGGLNIRTPDAVLDQEARLHDFKRDAVLAFVRANTLNHNVLSGGRNPKIGVITVGKSYLDVRQAHGRTRPRRGQGQRHGAASLQGRLPMAAVAARADRVRARARPHHRRRGEALADRGAGPRGALRHGEPARLHRQEGRGGATGCFPVKGALDPNDIAIAIGERLLRYHNNDDLRGRVERLKQAQRVLALTGDVAVRTPHFCSGCPHNTSTKVPEGMRAYAGIGCHYMAQWMDREHRRLHPDGRRGRQLDRRVQFLEAPARVPEPRRRHLQPLGLAGAALGGRYQDQRHLQDPVQRRRRHDRRAAARGRADGRHDRPPGARRGRRAHRARHRRAGQVPDGDRVAGGHDDPPPRRSRTPCSASSREVPGVSVLIYDQTCAAEKRRRRKRGAFPDPDKRVIINDLVCEACGDCSVQSNCVAVQPVETEFGRKRPDRPVELQQGFFLREGLLPVLRDRARREAHARPCRRRSRTEGMTFAALPEPAIPAIEKTFNIVVTGVGGTGVVTIGAILGMAAHLEGKGWA